MAATESMTILFTDLVGSTELSYSRSPEAADELRRAHFSILRRVLAESGGFEVKSLGDGIMASFPAASSALACAVAMQQQVELEGRRGRDQLAMRVGLSAGEVTREGEDCFGDPVIEAARLCARAEPGQILLGSLVQAMAGRRNAYALRPMGELELKGVVGAVETLELVWEPLATTEVAPAAEGIPLPRRLEYVPATGVIGREVHTQHAAAALKRAAGHQGREVLLIAGEAGQGKTTLAAEVARRAYDEGAVVLLGRCDEELGVPYGPFIEALQHYVAHAELGALQRHVETHGPALSRLCRGLASRLGDLPPPDEVDADTERYRLYGAVVGILEEASRDRPLVLVLDDVQWADAASLQLLRHVVKMGDALGLLIICTYRDTELSSLMVETLGALRRETGVDRIALRGLEDDEVVRFLEAASGHDLTESGLTLAHAVYEETDGNPFFVSEMLRHLEDSGAIYRDEAGTWRTRTTEMLLPASVKEVVAARVARLGPEAGRVLGLAAVIGRRIRPRASLHGCGTRRERGHRPAGGSLEDGARARGTGRSRQLHLRPCSGPAHPLRGPGGTRRARAHRKVAEVLEELCGADSNACVGELAHHWLQATQLVDVGKAVTYARRAGEMALDALAPADAVRYFEQALELLEHSGPADAAAALDVRILLGIAQRQAGSAAYRETLLEAARLARRAGDRDRLVRAALSNNRGFFSALGVVDDERVAVLQEALEATRGEESPERAALLATLCSELAHGSLERRLELAREATALARRLGEPATLVDVLNLQQLSLGIPSTLEERTLATAEALGLARAAGGPGRLFLATQFDRTNAVQGADFERAARRLEELTSIAAEFGRPTMVWVATFHQAAEALIRGDHQRAEELATAALQLGTDAEQPDAFAIYGAQLANIRAQQGRLEELAALIVDVATQNPNVPAYQATLAGIRADSGHYDEAGVLLRRAALDDFGSMPVDLVWLDTLCIYARVATVLEDRAVAGQLVALLEPYHRQIPFQGVNGALPVSCSLARLLSVIGDHVGAERYLTEALETSRRGRMAFAETEIKLAWGRTLLRKGDRSDAAQARTLLLEAQGMASAGGYGAIERSCAEALGATPG